MLQRHLPAFHQIPRADLRVGALAAAIAVVAAVAGYLVVRSRRPSATERERRRRHLLATTGRITDGVLEDARQSNGEEAYGETPDVLLYQYQLAGVTYHCAQDVSLLAEQVRGFRIDQPVQVRYQPGFPGNSVIVTEEWTGLRLGERKRWA